MNIDILKTITRTHTNSSGTETTLGLSPTLNQTSTGGAVDLLINRTETVLGSGSQRFIDCQIASTSKFVVDNAGRVGVGIAPNASYMLDVSAGASAVQVRATSTGGGATLALSGTFTQIQGQGTGGFFITNNVAGQSLVFRTDAGTARLTIAGTTGLATFANDVKIAGNVGFYNTNATAKQTVTGVRNSNTALASLLTALATIGLITDSTTAT